MRTLWALCAVLTPSLAIAAPSKLTLEEVIAKAVANPRVRMAEGDAEAAAARVDEADASRYPRIKVTAFGTLSPVIHCVPDPTTCTETQPKNLAVNFTGGVFGGGQIDITQPLYTFGKIDHARSAARAGLDAQRALADEAAGDAASDAARAYWGLKLARELGGMLDDGIDEIEKAKKGFEEKKDVSIADRERVGVLLAEVKTQRADAAQGEAQALAGLRALVGDPDADIDDKDLVAVEHVLPKGIGVDRRPQWLAAKSGARAATELAGFEYSQYFPDIALVGGAIIAGATGVDDPPSVFAYDIYNRIGAGVVLGLQWTGEPWNVKTRVARAAAEARKMHAQEELAERGAHYDGDLALSEAIAAHAKVDASAEGEKAARAWLASILQLEAIGTAESRDLVDAYIAWFRMRNTWANAVFSWNVAVVRMQRAAGEFQATAARPR